MTHVWKKKNNNMISAYVIYFVPVNFTKKVSYLGTRCAKM